MLFLDPSEGISIILDTLNRDIDIRSFTKRHGAELKNKYSLVFPYFKIIKSPMNYFQLTMEREKC